jgi:hypothetical protein
VRPRLFHVSEDSTIARFEPRPVPSPDSGIAGLAVWAVAESYLPNYLLPRDCPRVCFRAGPNTSRLDRDRFLGAADRIVAFEAAWLDRVRAVKLALYGMPGDVFEEVLPHAGYWISRRTLEPSGVGIVDDALSTIVMSGTEVRILQDFWTLSDAVAASTMQFSIIRKRGAQSRRG